MARGQRDWASASLLTMLIVINVTLAIFNMIPIPPLDGSRVVDGLDPLRLAARSGNQSCACRRCC